MGLIITLAVSAAALLLVVWAYYHYSGIYNSQQTSALPDQAADVSGMEGFLSDDTLDFLKYKLASQKVDKLLVFYQKATFQSLLDAGLISFVDLPLETGQVGKENPFQLPEAPEFLLP